jgi:hypothetical protein
VDRIKIVDSRYRKSDADICRENGWTVGTILEGDEGYGPDQIQITAIGETKILAKRIRPRECSETSWTLALRNWKKVGDVQQ